MRLMGRAITRHGVEMERNEIWNHGVCLPESIYLEAAQGTQRCTAEMT